MFQLATTEETAEVWNNIFYFDASVANGYRAMRSSSDIGAAWTAGGTLNLGRNWINADWGDSDQYHSVPGQLNGIANLITGASAPIDVVTLLPLASSTVIDAGVAGPAAVASITVDAQLSTNYGAMPRTVKGSAIDLGALER